MSREELIEAMAEAIAPFEAGHIARGGTDSMMHHRYKEAVAKARDILSVLNPLLERVAGGLEPFAEIAGELQPHLSDEHRNNMAWATPSVGQFRQAASLHTELKGLLP